MTETGLAMPGLPAPCPGHWLAGNQIAELAQEFVLAYVSEETRRAYWQDFSNLLIFTGQRFPTRADVIAWRDKMMGEGLAPSTIARRLSVARRFFGWLNRQGVIGQSPAEDVRSQPVSQEGKTPALTQTEAEALLAQPNLETSKGWRDYALLNLLVRTGLRRGEAARLTCGDLSEDNGMAVLAVNGKGGKQRRIRIMPDALDPILRWAQIAGLTPTDPIFPAWNGKGRGRLSHRAMSGTAIWNLVTGYANQACLPGARARGGPASQWPGHGAGGQAGLNGKRISPHCLRATFTTLAIEAGAPVHRTSHDLGHADLSTTVRYYRAFDELKDAATTYIHLGVRKDVSSN